MGPVPIVHMVPDRQMGSALIRCFVGAGIGSFPDCGLDESFGLAIGFGRIGLGADVFEAQLAAGIAEGAGLVAWPIVGHHMLYGDPQ